MELVQTRAIGPERTLKAKERPQAAIQLMESGR
jgi:hypothetical protein